MSRRVAAALLALAAASVACRTGYAERMAEADRAYQRGELEVAAAALEVGDDDTSAHADLLRLERAMALAAAGRRAESAALLMAADARLEELDYTRAPITDLARQLFTVETQVWRPGRVDRVLINTGNLLNFLLLGDRESAAVEARRARILLTQADVPADERVRAPLAWALAGLALETAGRQGEAADAWRELGDDDFARAPGPGQGSVAIVVQADRAPVRRATDYWLPLGGALRRLEIPVAVARPRKIHGGRISVDGGPWRALPSRMDVAGQVLERDARARPRLLAAAALQMLPRAAATDALRDRIGDGQGGSRDAAAQIGGVALDAWLGDALPADTRTWTLLPAEVYLDRVVLPVGRHVLRLELLGAEPRRLEWEFTLAEGELAVMDLVTAAGPAEPLHDPGPPLAAPDAGRNLADTPEGWQALELLAGVLGPGLAGRLGVTSGGGWPPRPDADRPPFPGRGRPRR